MHAGIGLDKKELSEEAAGLITSENFSSASGEIQDGSIFAGQYQIVRLLGKGANGTVYEANHLLLEHAVALKLFPKTLLDDPQTARRFQTEAKAIASFQHAHIVKAHAAGVSNDGIPFIATEYIDGITLEELLQQHSLNAEQFFPIFEQILDGLDYAHHSGIAHRDLKPSNIMISKTGQVKILDFGIAKFLSTDLPDQKNTKTGILLGSPAYMSPEQASGSPIDQRSDLYTIGIMIYQCITGRLPFEGESALHLMYQKLNSAPPLVVSHPESHFNDGTLDRVIDRCLKKDPNDRYQNAGQIQLDLACAKQAGGNITKDKKARSKNRFQEAGTWLFVPAAIIAAAFLILHFIPERRNSNPDSIRLGLRKSAEFNDAEEYFHHTRNAKIGRTIADPVSLILYGRNDYHSADHQIEIKERMMLVQRSVEEYNRAPSLLKKKKSKADPYLLYLAHVGKARSLQKVADLKFEVPAEADLLSPRTQAADTAVRSTPEPAKPITGSKTATQETPPDYRHLEIEASNVPLLKERLSHLREAEQLCPKNSYESGVITNELGGTLIALGQKQAGIEYLYRAIDNKEHNYQWSAGAQKYSMRDGLTEEDKPETLLDTYRSLIQIETARGANDKALKVYERMLVHSKPIRGSTNQENIKTMCRYAQILFHSNEVSNQTKAVAVLDELTNRCDKLTVVDKEEKATDLFILAHSYNLLKKPDEALKLLKQADLLHVSDLMQNRAASMRQWITNNAAYKPLSDWGI